jgi:c-di-GMP-binding flagellar brake protein YcgR
MRNENAAAAAPVNAERDFRNVPTILTKPRLAVGLMVQMELFHAGQTQRLQTKVVGWRDGHYLIVDTPLIDGKRVMHQFGKNVVIRYVLGGVIFGFATRLTGVQQNADFLWFLSFPEDAEARDLRRRPRVDTFLFADSGGGERWKIINVSENGALVVADRIATTGEAVNLSFTLPNGVLIKDIAGKVRRTESRSQGVALGVEFDETEQQQRRLIAQFADAYFSFHARD